MGAFLLGGKMEYIKKEEVLRTLQKLIDARKCQCAKTTLIEKRAFEYAVAIINKQKVYEFDENSI